MKLFLPSLAKESNWQFLDVLIEERLPPHQATPCTLHCDYKAEAVGDGYYVLHLKTKAQVEIICLRCMKPFLYEYENAMSLAICDNETVAETAMADYECIVTNNYHIELTEVLTDELHLYLPEKHPNPADCE